MRQKEKQDVENVCLNGRAYSAIIIIIFTYSVVLENELVTLVHIVSGSYDIKYVFIVLATLFVKCKKKY